MKKSKKILETFQMIMSIIALTVTLVKLLRGFIAWTKRYE
jgi:hypothetical protein